MEEKRDETYERIPWEMLERPAPDRQWLILGVAAAVVAGAIGYTFVSSRAVSAPADPPPVSIVQASPSVSPPVEPAPPVSALPPVSTAPPIVAQADLYAVPPERLASEAKAYAEFFVSEYLTVDGSESERSVLRALLPPDIPLPSAPPGTVVFVEWVGAVGIDEIGVGRYIVDVLARYMVANEEHPYQRYDPEMLSVLVEVGDSGTRVLSAPVVSSLIPISAQPAGIGEMPPEISARALEVAPGGELVGGLQDGEGVWTVIALVAGPDGIKRPVQFELSP